MKAHRYAALCIVRTLGVTHTIHYARLIRHSCLTPHDRSKAIVAVASATNTPYRYHAVHFVDLFRR